MKFNKRKVFLILILLWFFFIFFVWRKFDPETGKRHFIVTTNWINHFRKWLDVSWWTKLVYKISYDKYEQIYTNKTELAALKKRIEDIILKNIDNRISKLGVSDYKAYVQTLDTSNYIVVEIWWVADLDQAKWIIWKTVELEFKLQNKEEPTKEFVQKRKEMAQGFYAELVKDPSLLKQIWDGRWSQNVFYNLYSGVTSDQLPDVYKNKLWFINSIEIWKLNNEIIEWKYASIEANAQQGIQTGVELNWFTMFRVLNRKENSLSTVSSANVKEAASKLWLSVEQKKQEDVSVKVGEYDYNEKSQTLTFNESDFAKWVEAYDVRIYAVNKPTALGATKEQTKINDEIAQKNLDQIKKTIKQNSDYKWTGVKVSNDGWMEKSKLNTLISAFTDQKDGEVKEYKQLNTTYVVYMRAHKASNQNMNSVLIISKMTSALKKDFDKLVKTKTTYTIEDIFVQDKETWLSAVDSQDRLLNWAFFKFANTSTDQLGKPVVVINLDDVWKEVFCDISDKNIWNPMAIFVWGNLLTSPTIQTKICWWTAQIDWTFTVEEAKKLVDDLNDGALPAPLVLMQEEKISPSLWDNALTWAMRAGLLWFLAICILIRSMYGLKKMILTAIVLISFLAVLFWFVKLIDYALSLSGIAALILAIGMWVDANILIEERLREEIKSGKKYSSAIDHAKDRSRSAIRDGQISTWIIWLVLFSLWTNVFKWFGFMTMLTVILTLVFNVPLTKELLHMFFDKSDKE